MKRIVLIVTLVLVGAMMAFAAPPAPEGSLEGQIKVAGSSTVYPITVAVAEEFSKMHPNVEIAVQSTGTGGGFKNFFIPGMTQINDASRPMKDSEREDALANGITPIEFHVATDAITFVVSPDADWIDGVTVEELDSPHMHMGNPDRRAFMEVSLLSGKYSRYSQVLFIFWDSIYDFIYGAGGLFLELSSNPNAFLDFLLPFSGLCIYPNRVQDGSRRNYVFLCFGCHRL